VPEWSNGTGLGPVGLVPPQVQTLSPAYRVLFCKTLGGLRSSCFFHLHLRSNVGSKTSKQSLLVSEKLNFSDPANRCLFGSANNLFAEILYEFLLLALFFKPGYYESLLYYGVLIAQLFNTSKISVFTR
jgi:hypothetical protein